MNLYVIGPVTGKPKDNLPAFINARNGLWAAGYYVYIPHDIITTGTEWRYAMARSVEHISNEVRRYGDKFGIAHAGWLGATKGARIEHDLAEALGIPCKPWREWL